MANGMSISGPVAPHLNVTRRPVTNQETSAVRGKRSHEVSAVTIARRQLTSFGLALILPAVVLAVWHVTSSREWVSPLVLPTPATVWETFKGLYQDGTIRQNLTVSAWRILKGFAVGAFAGTVLGAALGASKKLAAYVSPVFFALTQVNVIAWVPLFILVFGIDEPLKIAIITWSSGLPVAIIVMKGIADIPRKWFELARVQELSRARIARWILLPAMVPVLFTGLRSGLGAAWISLIVVELIASSEGIGFMVVWGRQLFQLDVVMVAILIIGTIGGLLDTSLKLVESKLGRWRQA